MTLFDLVRGRQNFGTRQNGFLINDFFDFLKSETLKKNLESEIFDVEEARRKYQLY